MKLSPIQNTASTLTSATFAEDVALKSEYDTTFVPTGTGLEAKAANFNSAPKVAAATPLVPAA